MAHANASLAKIESFSQVDFFHSQLTTHISKLHKLSFFKLMFEQFDVHFDFKLLFLIIISMKTLPH